MGVSGVSGANDMMLQMMQLLMQGMNEQLELNKDMIALGVESGFAAEKMALAQGIIDVYA